MMKNGKSGFGGLWAKIGKDGNKFYSGNVVIETSSGVLNLHANVYGNEKKKKDKDSVEGRGEPDVLISFTPQRTI